ncbi:MAG: polyprenol monophosphomannose synthase [Nitrospirae bacterium]|nr:polyprenol monophosphomannose synthase [Nitrospirota bacterium]MCL5284926.1 polyprenol monophosphomannose synthase [Nitrospirota bacterium]
MTRTPPVSSSFELAPLPGTEAIFSGPADPPKTLLRVLMTVPTYNESENIEALLNRIISLGPEYGVLVVDDHSPDGTSGVVRNFQSQCSAHVYLLERFTNRGRGQAGIDGYRQALFMNVPVIGEMDADGSHAPEDLPAMMARLSGKTAGVIGSRLVPGGREEGRTLSRVLLTRAANLYIRILLGLPYRDTTSGFRIFRREVLAGIPWEDLVSRGPSLLQEMLVIIHRAGWTLAESPITFRDRVLGTSTLNRRILMNSLRIVLEFRRRYGRSSLSGRVP